MKACLISICLFVSSLTALYAGTLSVTEVNVEGNLATIVVNEVVKISEIEVKGSQIDFPSYTTSSGKNIPQVRVTEPAAYEVIRKAILTKQPSNQVIKKIQYKVSKMSTYNKAGSSLQAFAAVTINGALEIECKIMKSKNRGELYVTWPARPPDRNAGEFRWVNQVEFVNAKVKSIIEQGLLKSFEEAPAGGMDMTKNEVEIREGASQLPISVSKVDIRKAEAKEGLIGTADVELNYSFIIKDVKLYRKRDALYLELPVNEYKGRSYDFMKILTRSLSEEIKKSIETQQPSEDKYEQISFEITKFEKNRWESSVKYKCAVTVNMAMEIECKIIDSGKYSAFVAWPSKKIGDDYFDMVVPCNKAVKNAIENALISKYNKEKNK